MGLVASSNRPGGNLTGLTQDAVETAAKQLQVVKDMLPTAVQIAARSLQLTVQVLRASTERDIDAATLAQEPFDALHVMSDQSFFGRRAQLAAPAKRQALPAVYALRQYVEAGGLISYGPDLADNYRYAGIYTGRILKGEKLADLPVVQPTKIELVINLTTAPQSRRDTLRLVVLKLGEERMKRRDFVTGVLLAATIPHAQAQQHSKLYRLALAAPSTPITEMKEASGHPVYRPLFEELKRLGYIEGRNLVVDPMPEAAE